MSKIILTGSFDPITNGHLALVKTCARLFGQVHVVAFLNADKVNTYTSSQREEMLAAACRGMENVVTASDDGMVVDYCRRNGINIIVRGLRGREDLDYEMTMAKNNSIYDSSVATFFLPADEEHGDISSSEVRRRFALGEDISHLVPAGVAELMEKYSQNI